MAPSSSLSLPAKFITAVWSRQREPTADYFGFISVKDWDSGDWSDHPVTHHSRNPIRSAEITHLRDLYFTPCLFREPRRLRRTAVSSRWLYADLDEVDPYELPAHFTPTLAWETSPQRYQALWLLDRPLQRKAFESLNQRLTYAIGADKGGWSVTKVLRIPGSVSHKREEPFEVRLIPRTHPPRPTHSVEDMQRHLAHINTSKSSQALPSVPNASTLPDTATVRSKRLRRVPNRARQLLKTSIILQSDDRSARLWELENLLLDAGLSLEETFVLVRDSPWNKFQGRPNQLWRDIHRAAANRADPARPTRRTRPPSSQPKTNQTKKTKNKKPKQPDFGLVRIGDFLTRSFKIPSWMVEGLWSTEALGFLAGESKSFKSLFAMDLAVSVSTGTAFLNRFPVPRIGPVCIWQEENHEGLVQDRMWRIMASRGLAPMLHQSASDPSNPTLDMLGANPHLHIANRQGVNLGDRSHLRKLDRALTKIKPVLVILDPLYMMTPGLDENDASQMIPILKRLTALQQKHKTSILIVHHYHKPNASTSASRPMHRMSGSGVFGRRYDSAIWVETLDDDGNVKISSSHRASLSNGAFHIKFHMPPEEELAYSVDVDEWTDDLERQARADNTVVRLDLSGNRVDDDSDFNGNELLRITGGVHDEPVRLTKPRRVRDLAKEMGARSSDLTKFLRQQGFQITDEPYKHDGELKHVRVVHPRDGEEES